MFRPPLDMTKHGTTLVYSPRIGLIALLYSSVGHAGHRGTSHDDTFRTGRDGHCPDSLCLNILVDPLRISILGAVTSLEAFWHLVLSFGAYVGGYLQPSASILRILIGCAAFLRRAAVTRRTIARNVPSRAGAKRRSRLGCLQG